MDRTLVHFDYPLQAAYFGALSQPLFWSPIFKLLHSSRTVTTCCQPSGVVYAHFDQIQEIRGINQFMSLLFPLAKDTRNLKKRVQAPCLRTVRASIAPKVDGLNGKLFGKMILKRVDRDA